MQQTRDGNTSVKWSFAAKFVAFKINFKQKIFQFIVVANDLLPFLIISEPFLGF